MKTFMQQIERFNKDILDMNAPAQPTRLPAPRKEWAAAALAEEVEEFIEATTIEEEADALLDLMYFAMGRFYEMGVDPLPIATEVQRANMQKVRGTLAKRAGSLGYDAVKPEGWQPPKAVIKPWPLSTGQRPPRVAIIGPARHGKDTVADMLAAMYGLRFANASRLAAMRVIMPATGNKYKTLEECYNERINNRVLWRDLLAAFNNEDETAFGCEIFSVSDIYCGVRRKAEMRALQEEGVVQFTVWVDAAERLNAEDETLELAAADADFVVKNNGTLEELTEKLALFGDIIYGGDYNV